MGLGRWTSNSLIHTDLHKPDNKLVSACWNTFGARTSHGQTRTHKTHHGPDLGEATTFPLMYILYLSTRPTSKWHFVPGLPSGNPKIPKIGTLTTLRAHNFVYRPPIDMRFKEKFYPSSRSFNDMLHATCTQGN